LFVDGDGDPVREPVLVRHDLVCEVWIEFF